VVFPKAWYCECMSTAMFRAHVCLYSLRSIVLGVIVTNYGTEGIFN
jgi:hypothetical protein